jgi:hypothetical protein
LGNAWQIGGNAGIGSDHFLGTTDDMPLRFKVNNTRGLQLAYASNPTFTGINVVGGYDGNLIDTGVVGDVIAGGGSSGYENRVRGDFATVVGGHGNSANGDWDTVISGYENTTTGPWATIGGGKGNTANGDYATVVGGGGNTVEYAGTIAGGTINEAASDATVVGGAFNAASGGGAVVGGGNNNTASGGTAVVVGGVDNIASGGQAAVVGGDQNTASGDYATVSGGRENIASGEGAFVAGQNASATHDGAFVWGDGSAATASFANNSVTFRASGGFKFYTLATTYGAELAAGATSWSVLSDRNMKKNAESVNTREILDKLAQIPVSRWSYLWEPDDATPYLGPMAQDFKAAFYPGRDDKRITTMEFDGVALAAIQGLNRKLEEAAMSRA